MAASPVLAAIFFSCAGATVLPAAAFLSSGNYPSPLLAYRRLAINETEGDNGSDAAGLVGTTTTTTTTVTGAAGNVTGGDNGTGGGNATGGGNGSNGSNVTGGGNGSDLTGGGNVTGGGNGTGGGIATGGGNGSNGSNSSNVTGGGNGSDVTGGGNDGAGGGDGSSVAPAPSSTTSTSPAPSSTTSTSPAPSSTTSTSNSANSTTSTSAPATSCNSHCREVHKSNGTIIGGDWSGKVGKVGVAVCHLHVDTLCRAECKGGTETCSEAHTSFTDFGRGCSNSLVGGRKACCCGEKKTLMDTVFGEQSAQVNAAVTSSMVTPLMLMGLMATS